MTVQDKVGQYSETAGVAQQGLTSPLGTAVTFIVALCALCLLIPLANARNGTYNMTMVQVLYSDTRTAPYTTTQLTAAAGEMQRYFRDLSFGNLDLRINVVEVHLSQTNAFYNSGCLPSGDSRSPCPPPLFADAVEQAALTGIDFSRVNGVILVQPNCGGDYTSPSLVTISSPHASGRVAVSNDFSCPGTVAVGASEVAWEAWAQEIGHQLQIADGVPIDEPWKGSLRICKRLRFDGQLLPVWSRSF